MHALDVGCWMVIWYIDGSCYSAISMYYVHILYLWDNMRDVVGFSFESDLYL